MRAYFEYTGKIDLSTILPGHNGLQGRFEQSKVAMSETGLNGFSGEIARTGTKIASESTGLTATIS